MDRKMVEDAKHFEAQSVTVDTQADDGAQLLLTDILDQLLRCTDGEKTEIGTIFNSFRDRSFGALYTIIGLVASLPLIGAIPGVSLLTATLIFLIAVQSLFGRRVPWIPDVLNRRTIPNQRLKAGINWLRPYAGRIDAYVKPRADWIVSGVVQRYVMAISLCLLAIMMWPLALVPWGVQAPAVAVVVFGIAMLGRDGRFAIAGYALFALTIYTAYAFQMSMQSTWSWFVSG